MSQVHILESELTVQRREAQELRADLEACRLEKSSVQKALETTLEEKKRITDKLNNSTMMGRFFMLNKKILMLIPDELCRKESKM